MKMMKEFKIFLVFVVCLGVICFFGVMESLLKAKQEPVEMVVNGMLLRAMRDPMDPQALEEIAEAGQYLAENKSGIDDLICDFLATSIMKTRGEVLAARWRQDNSQVQDRDEARGALLEAVKSYVSLQEQGREKIGLLEKRYGIKVDQSEHWRQLNSYITRSNYDLGWIFYNLAVISEGEGPKDVFLHKALNKFKNFTSGGYRNHPVIAKCFLGQALCLYEFERYYEVLELLGLDRIDAMNTEPETYKRISYLRIKAARELPSQLKVIQSAQQYFSALPSDPQLDAVELELLTEWGRSLKVLIDNLPADDYQQAAIGRLESIAQMVYPYGDPWCKDLAEIMGELSTDSPFVCLAQARRYFGEKKYRQVIEKTEKAMANLQADASERLRADLSYLKTASFWNLGQWRQGYLSAWEFLAEHGEDERSAGICRCGIQAGIKMLETGEKFEWSGFLRFLDFVEKGWPENPEVRKIAWYRGRVLLEMEKYPEAEVLLLGIPVDSEFYGQALYGIALSAYRQAEQYKAKDSATESSETAIGPDKAEAKSIEPPTGSDEDETVRNLLSRSAEALENYTKLVKSKTEADVLLDKAVLQLSLAVCRGLLDMNPPGAKATLELLGNLESMSVKNEILYHRQRALNLEAQAAAGNLEEVLVLLQSAMRMETTDKYVILSMVKASDKLEETVREQSGQVDKILAENINQKLLELYRYLFKYAVVGREKGAIEEAALRGRLAESLLRCGRKQEAINNYRWLLENLPREQRGGIMRKLALTYEQVENYDEAIVQWRTLAKGLPPETESWLEAQYNLIRCNILAQRKDQARKLLGMFQLRHGAIESERWRVKFDELDEKLNNL
ncbi:MAG: hypothetical protein JXD22_10070 [Sedimentisphaerales bacterium]|nr:hypothetical protein [Sedimentisphaerales bacterium]